MSTKSPWIRSRVGLCLCVLGSLASSQAPHARLASYLGPRTVLLPREGLELRLDPATFEQDRFVLKFAPGHEVRLGKTARLGRTLQCKTLDLEAVKAALEGTTVERLFTRSVADLDAERRAILARLPKGASPPADLNNWYRVRTKGRKHSLALLRTLPRLAAVETAFPEFRLEAMRPAGLPLSPKQQSKRAGQHKTLFQAPNFESLQEYLDLAPKGIGFHPAVGILGVEGNPQQSIVQLEASWIFGHEDLPQLTRSRVLGTTKFGILEDAVWRNHGAAAVSIFHAACNAYGTRGIVPRSSLYVSSVANGLANMVSLAMKKAKAGDVFTSSFVFAIAYKGKGYHTPLDYPPDAYDAIRNATLKGICVTAAAGNTGADLGTEAIYGKRYLTSSTASGAFLVGATFGPARMRVSWSNYGSRVTLSAWGALVTTAGYGHLHGTYDGIHSYTWQFGGSSAASPQVAGVIASIQSVAMTSRAQPYTPSEILRALTRFGTYVAGIGPRPDLHATLKGLGLIAGLETEGDSRPGTHADATLSLGPYEPYLLFASTTRKPLSIGRRFFWQLDPAGMMLLDASHTDANGKKQLSFHLPADPRLQGLSIYTQAFRAGSPPLLFDISNAGVWKLR